MDGGRAEPIEGKLDGSERFCICTDGCLDILDRLVFQSCPFAPQSAVRSPSLSAQARQASISALPNCHLQTPRQDGCRLIQGSRSALTPSFNLRSVCRSCLVADLAFPSRNVSGKLFGNKEMVSHRLLAPIRLTHSLARVSLT